MNSVTGKLNPACRVTLVGCDGLVMDKRSGNIA
jgi:hypothetical protein